LAAVLRKNNYDVEIVDSAVMGYSYSELLEEILGHNPGIVGITAVTISIHNAAKLSRMIKQQGVI